MFTSYLKVNSDLKKEPMMGFELMTSSLPRMRSTPELHRLFWSGKRGSNSRPSAWKADALPTELLPRTIKFVGGGGLEPPNPEGADLQSAAIATMRTSQAFFIFEPIEGFEPTTPRLQITCSGQLSYIGGFSVLQSLKGIAKVDIILENANFFQSFSTSLRSCKNMPFRSILHSALSAA